MPSRILSACLFFLSLCLSSIIWSQGYDELVQRGLALRNQGNFPEAESLLRQAHNGASDQRETYYLLGMTVAFQDRFEEAESFLQEGLTIYPEDITLQIALARVQSFQGEFRLAEQQIDQVLENSPDNSDALNLQGRLALYQNQPRRAITVFDHVIELYPDNLEAMIGLHDAYQASGNIEQAELWLNRAEQDSPGHADVLSRQREPDQPEEANWQITYGYGTSHFKRIPLGDWYDHAVEIHRQTRDADNFLRVESSDHFGMSDTLISAGTTRRLRHWMPWGIRLDYSPDAVFIPDYRVRLFIAPRVRDGDDLLGATVLNLSAQYASYPLAEVIEYGLGVDQYLWNGQVWITPSLNMVNDEDGDRLTGWNLRVNWLANDRLFLGGGYGESPQTEAGSTASTSATHLFARYTLTDQLDVRADLVREDRENSYVRYGSTLSLTWTF